MHVALSIVKDRKDWEFGSLITNALSSIARRGDIYDSEIESILETDENSKGDPMLCRRWWSRGVTVGCP